MGRRPNGYHELESIFWPLNWGDELEIHPSEQLEVACEWDVSAPFKKGDLPQGHKNLASRALEGLGLKKKVLIRKKIPLGGGLGGGSSNAGTLIRQFGKKEAKLAESLGADVPFFLDPRPTWVTGIGEVLKPLPMDEELRKQLFFLLLVFDFPTSTPEIFQEHRELKVPFSPRRIHPPLKLSLDSLKLHLGDARNDLEPLVCRRSPAISLGLQTLRKTKAWHSALSGTGSTCYAIYESSQARELGAKDLADFCRIYHCSIVLAESM